MSINRRRLSLNLATGLLMETINKISPLLILHHAQKYLGLSGFGWAQYGLALLETLQPFVAYGYTNYAIAEIAREGGILQRCSQLFSSIAVLKTMHALLLILLCLIESSWQLSGLSVSEHIGLLVLILGSTALDAMWFVLVKRKLAIFTALGGLLRLGSLGLMIVLVNEPADKKLFVVLILLPNALMALASGLYAWRQLKWDSPQHLLQVFWGATPFALIAIMLIVYDRFDVLLVKQWFGLEMAGAYAGPARVVQSLIMFTGSIVMAFYAEIVQAQDRESLFKHSSLSLWCLMALATPMVFGAPFVETDAMQLLFTHQMTATHGIFPILCLGIFGNVFIIVFGLQLLQLKAQPWKMIQALVPGLILGPLLAYSLRASLHVHAAAWGVVAGKLLAAVLIVWQARPLIGQFPWSSLSRTWVAGCGMALILKLGNWNGLLQNLLLGALVYLTALIILNRSQVWQIIQHPLIARFWRKNGL